MTLICIECRKEFATVEEAYLHTNRKVTKDSPVRVPMKKHVVFPKTGRDA